MLGASAVGAFLSSLSEARAQNAASPEASGAASARGRGRLLARSGGAGVAAPAHGDGRPKLWQDVRAWTPETSVAVNYFAPQTFPPVAVLGGRPSRASPAYASPDGQRFFVQSFRGDLASDMMVHRLDVYDVPAIARRLAGRTSTAVAPVASVELPSSAIDPFFAGIVQADWKDNRTIQYLGGVDQNGGGAFVLDTDTGTNVRLTPEGQRVAWFDAGNGVTVYIRADTIHAATGDYYPARRVTSAELVAPYGGDIDFRLTLCVRVGTGRPVEVLTMPAGGLYSSQFDRNGGIWVSPSGRHAVLLIDHGEPAPAWRGYRHGGASFQHIHRFMLLETASASLTDMSAPIGFLASERGNSWDVADDENTLLPQVYWFADAAHAVVVNAALPFDADTARRASRAFIAGYDVAAGRWTEIAALEDRSPSPLETDVRVVQVGWLRLGVELLVRRQTFGGTDLPGLVISLGDNGWERREVGPDVRSAPSRLADRNGIVPAPRLAGGISVRLRQSMNESPVVEVSNGRRRIDLTAPDPALRGKTFAPMREIEWTDPDGRSARGGLVLPPVAGGRRPPLVIQAYNYFPEVFAPDGFQSGEATQSLAARGIAVLRMMIPAEDRQELTGSTGELPFFVRRMEAAIAAVDRLGMADCSKVGLLGFSRGGLCVQYAITHPSRTPIAASAFIDSTTGSYFEYLNGPNSPGRRGIHSNESLWGMKSFWRNKEAWMAGAPGFNVDKVQGPLLVQSSGAQSLRTYAELRGAFYLNRRPFEWMLYKDSYHWMQRPRQRLAAMIATVDWFSFWLLGDENPDPVFAERNERWRAMRDRWTHVQEQERRGHLVGENGSVAYDLPYSW